MYQKKCLECLLDREYLDINDIAKVLQVSYYTVYRWIQNYQLKAYRFGGTWKVRKEDLLSFISTNHTFHYTTDELQKLWSPKKYKLKVLKKNI